ncbi:MAG TPA: nitroreductase family protein [Bacteroidota bacterium]|nr:nitroreductase family protein [Bacteroidota bacterium]
METQTQELLIRSLNAEQFQFPVHPLLMARKSPRAFADRPVEPEKLRSLLDAARWAPSASNTQPWRFIVASKERPEEHRRMANLLFEGNKVWAEKAPLLILSAAQVNDASSGKTNRFALYDVGSATQNLLLQASALGLASHVMGGFHAEEAKATFNIPAEFEPAAVIAVGYQGETESLPRHLQEREMMPRVRKPLTEFVFGEIWGKPSPALAVEQKEFHQSINN